MNVHFLIRKMGAVIPIPSFTVRISEMLLIGLQKNFVIHNTPHTHLTAVKLFNLRAPLPTRDPQPPLSPPHIGPESEGPCPPPWVDEGPLRHLWGRGEGQELVTSWIQGQASIGRLLWDGASECQTQAEDRAIPEEGARDQLSGLSKNDLSPCSVKNIKLRPQTNPGHRRRARPRP